jgi:hypothetical protein
MKIRFWMVPSLLLMLIAGGFRSTLHAQGFEIGAQLAVHSLPELGDTRAGYGFRFTYNGYPPFFALDSEINFFPTSSTGNLGETQLFAGVRAGIRVSRWGVYAKLRPGFADFGGGGDPERITSTTHFALDIGGVVEYSVAPRVALRFDASDVLTYFGGTSLRNGPGLVGTGLGTQHNFETTIGIVLKI